MAKMKITGMEDYIRVVEEIRTNVDPTIRESLYEGAKVVADELKTAISSLPAVEETYNLKVYQMSKKNNNASVKYKLSVLQKGGLFNYMGITKFDKTENKTSTHVGWTGYNNLKTKKYPKGQPNIMVARIVESGSSYFNKTPFINKTIRKARTAAEKEMSRKIEEIIENIAKE